MSAASFHRTRDGYTLTATVRRPDGTPVVMVERDSDLEKARERLMARIDTWIDALGVDA